MLYYLGDAPETVQLSRAKQVSLQDAGWTEKDLENLLAGNIETLVRTDQLFVILQERQMQEEADIIALDKAGTLYLFELKRWRGREDNLLQVLRYGQRFGRYEYERLNNFFASYQHRHGTTAPVPLQEAHQQYFSLDQPPSKQDFNKQQRFVVVTNGLDRATYDAIEYWKSYGLPIDALVYRLYREEPSGRVLIDFDPYGPEPSSPESLGEGLFVVNTNWTYDSEAYRDMLQNNKAAAYGSRKWGVTAIRRGCVVCLYHVNVGVVAIGKASDDYHRTIYDGVPDDEFYAPCHFEFKVDPITEPERAVKAWEINAHFHTGHRFRQTVFSLPAEFAAFIRQKFEEKRRSAAGV